MPNQDGTGPFGNGTPGRGMGPCGRFGTSVRGGFGFGRGRGRGFGRGFGFRRGWRWNWDAYDRPVDYPRVYEYSREELQAQKDELQKQLEWLNQQLTKEEKK